MQTLKDALAVAREIIILTVLIALLCFPRFVDSRLRDAGFIKANIGGFEWERIQEAAAETQDARQKIDAVQQTLKKVSTELSTASGTGLPSGFAAQVERSLATVQAANSELQRSAQTQQRILDSVAPTQPQANGGTWAIVVGADKMQAEAERERARATALGLGPVSIYERQGWLRTVITFDSRHAAQEALSETRRRVRDSAYIVAIERWCPSPVTQGDAGILRCAAVSPGT